MNSTPSANPCQPRVDKPALFRYRDLMSGGIMALAPDPADSHAFVQFADAGLEFVGDIGVLVAGLRS